MDEHRGLLAGIIGGGVMRRRALIEALSREGVSSKAARESVQAFEEAGVIEPLWL